MEEEGEEEGGEEGEREEEKQREEEEKARRAKEDLNSLSDLDELLFCRSVNQVKVWNLTHLIIQECKLQRANDRNLILTWAFHKKLCLIVVD